MENINLLALSGKIGSGKNTVAKIIQALTSIHGKNGTRDIKQIMSKIDDEGYGYADYYEYNSDWQQKAFAAKLKQIASILTGIDTAEFEKQEVKDSYLGTEWNIRVETMPCGCDIIMKHYHKDGKCTNCLEPTLVEYKQQTCRTLLQRLGTEAIRNQIHSNAWVNALFADYKPSKKEGGFNRVVKDNGIPVDYEYEVEYPNWIITDLRFPNEFDAIKSRGGICIRIERYNEDGSDYGWGNSASNHPSETALDNHTFDYTLNNNSTIDDLIIEVKKMLEYYKII